MVLRSGLLIGFIFLALLLSLRESYSFDRCSKYVKEVKKAHRLYFGIDFPYWYSMAQLRVESNCIWRAFSKDGWGSVGPAQITPSFWGRELSRILPDWKESPPSYFMAQAYILRKAYDYGKCKKLYEMYQCYNRNCRKVDSENWPVCKWEFGLENCMKRPERVCVYKKDGKCLQYKTSCDINYEYSLKIYNFGRSESDFTGRYQYW